MAWRLYTKLLPLLPQEDGIAKEEADLPLALRGGGPYERADGRLALSAPLLFTLVPLCTWRELVHMCIGIQPTHSSHKLLHSSSALLLGQPALGEGLSSFVRKFYCSILGTQSVVQKESHKLQADMYRWSWRLLIALVRTGRTEQRAQDRGPSGPGLRADTGNSKGGKMLIYRFLNYLTHYSKYSGI